MAHLIAYTLVFVSVTGTASADSFNTSYGQSTCQTNIDNSDGRSLEFYGEVDTKTDDATIGFKYVIEFQKPPVYNTCRDAQRLAERRMRLDIEKQELELQLLRARVNTESEETPTEPLSSNW